MSRMFADKGSENPRIGWFGDGVLRVTLGANLFFLFGEVSGRIAREPLLSYESKEFFQNHSLGGISAGHGAADRVEWRG